MSDSKTITEHEHERGVIAVDRKKYPANKKLTAEEFEAVMLTPDFLGIDYESRTDFLTKNGYELTHANMINADLPSKPQED